MKSLGLPIVLSILVAGIGLAADSGQSVSPATQKSEAKPAPLRATTRMVEMSVIVRDKHDELVTGLNKSDFTVLDSGKPQTIQIFFVTTNRPPSHPPSSLPPNTYSNRVPGTGDAPANITVVLLDALNTDSSDQAFANQRVVKFLQQLQPQDRLALYTLGNRLRILHDFTSDASSLVAALKDYKGQLSDLDKPDIVDLGPANTMASRLGADEVQYERERDQNRRVHLTLEAMMEIARHVAPLPGRKNLIWVSGSFPLSSAYLQSNPTHERILFAREIESTAEALADEALVIYPVDARGLVPTDVENFAGPDAFEFMTMKSLAAETGGRAFFNSNDIGGAIRAAIDDSRMSYELGYSPTIEKWDGTFRNVKVKVNRPGVHVRTRKGYFALPDPGPPPFEEHAIDVTVRVDNAEADARDSRPLTVDVRMDPRQLDLKLQDGRRQGIVNLLFVQLDDQYRVLDTLQQPYHLMLLPATYEQPPAEGFKLTHVIQIVPNASHLRVIVRDNSTGLAGAVGVPLAKYFPAQAKPSN